MGHVAVEGGVADAPGGAATGASGSALGHASRSVLKATHVPLRADTPSRGAAVAKLGYVRQLSLQPGDVASVRAHLAANARAAGADGAAKHSDLADHPMMDLLEQFERPLLPVLLPKAAAFADVPLDALTAFGHALAQVRTQAASAPPPAPEAAEAAGMRPGMAKDLVNRAATAAAWLSAYAHPIGMLNLERLEMAPAGIERGELIATIPLAPMEQTAVTQKEWSVTTKEFTSIVTDSLENYSEKGVTDNTELAQSVTSQTQHANQFNITSTVSGSMGVVSGSTTASFGSQDSQSASATDSRKHAQSMTQKASSRAKTEHKVTVSTTTISGTSETTTRVLQNPSTTDPIRIDYFSMMRKWRVRLYRYGLRLTYDIVIPEPGSALRRAHAQLAWLKAQLGPFEFNVPHSEITPAVWPGETEPHYLVLADQYQAQVPFYPVGKTIHPQDTSGGAQSWRFFPLKFHVDDNLMIDSLTVHFHIGLQDDGKAFHYGVEGTEYGHVSNTPLPETAVVLSDPPYNAFKGSTGDQVVTFFFDHAADASVVLDVVLVPTQQAIEQWQADVWNSLYNAAQNQYYAQQQDIADRIAALEAALSSVDTLTLRREENDELMKQVLRFLLGTDFAFMPDDVRTAFINAGTDLVHGIEPDGNKLNLTSADWTTLMQHEDKVKFINEAIEWENVLTYLYSYFWDLPDSWDFIRQIKHPDPTRQAFLRAGSARVVLTVRKGWEEAWVRYAEGGVEDAAIDPNHPYLTVAQEIAAYDDRNYPGIAPANPAASAVRPEDTVATTCAAAFTPATGAVTVEVASSAGFVVGLPVVIDVAGNPGPQEAQLLTAVPDATHLELARLDKQHDGSRTPFPIIQPGEKGTLIAEWNEYTPTSGTDIAVTSNLATIA